MADLKKLLIDGILVEVDPAMTIIQAAEVAGVEIPRFCYHERLTIAGNCRMCLVEVVGGPPKPAAILCDAGPRSAARPEWRACGGENQLAHGQEGP